MTAGRTFVLVHGMSHGAWAWDPVVPRLERAGHRALAVDLPGHGRRAHERAGASLEGYARAVAGAMAQAGVSGAVLVGHSMAGAVLPRVAGLVPARIARVVFLAAVVPPDGSTLLATHPPLAGRELLRGLARAGGGTAQYPASMARARWFGDLAPGDPRAVEALGRLTPQPWRPWTEPVALRAFLALPLPRSYVLCLRDAAVTPARAREYAARLGVTPIEMDADHGPMLTAPDALVEVLLRP